MYTSPCIEEFGVTDNFCVLEWGPQLGVGIGWLGKRVGGGGILGKGVDTLLQLYSKTLMPKHRYKHYFFESIKIRNIMLSR